jgi:nucleoside-diphosphate-sugar epimerase
MKALVTGGLGFIGANVVKRFLSKGWEVSVIDNISGTAAKRNIKLPFMKEAELILRDLAVKTVKPALTGVDLVIHCAADVRKGTNHPFVNLKHNAGGTLAVCEAVAKHDPSIPIIYTSSCLVYGQAESLPVDETAPTKPENNYNVSKLAGEKYLLAYKAMYGLKPIIFRLSNTYGPYQWGTEEQGLVGLIIFTALRGETFQFFRPFKGSQVRDPTYVDDLIDAMELALQKVDAVSGEVFNIGAGEFTAISVKDLVDLVSWLMKTPIKTEVGKLLRGDIKSYYADWRKAERMLGWKPKTSLEEGIPREIEWAKTVI